MKLFFVGAGLLAGLPGCQRASYPKFRAAGSAVRGPVVAAPGSERPAKTAAPAVVVVGDTADDKQDTPLLSPSADTVRAVGPPPGPLLGPIARPNIPSPPPRPPQVAPPARRGLRVLRAAGIGLGIGAGGAALLALSLGAAPLLLGAGVALSVLFLVGGVVVLGVRKLLRLP